MQKLKLLSYDILGYLFLLKLPMWLDFVKNYFTNYKNRQQMPLKLILKPSSLIFILHFMVFNVYIQVNFFISWYILKAEVKKQKQYRVWNYSIESYNLQFKFKFKIEKRKNKNKNNPGFCETGNMFSFWQRKTNGYS